MAKAAKLGDIYVSINARLDKFEKDLKKSQQIAKRQTGVMQRGFDRLNFDKARRSLSMFNKLLLASVGVYGLKRLSESFISAADTAENYRLRLNTLLGSTEEGGRAFKEMAEFASKVPFTYEEIMGSATQLAGIMRGGVDEIVSWMPLIADLAAASGLGIRETTEQITRMYSAGAAAAERFKERGILGMLGFKAKTAYTAKETRQILIKAFEDPASKFRGTAADLAKTWRGTMSMIEDKWFQFRNLIMDAGVYDALKSGLSDTNERFGRWIENNKELIKQNVPVYIDKITAALKAMGELASNTATEINWLVTQWKKLPEIEMKLSKMLRIPLTSREWVKQTQKNVDDYKHEIERLRVITGGLPTRKSPKPLSRPKLTPGGGDDGIEIDIEKLRKDALKRAEEDYELMLELNEWALGEEEKRIKESYDYRMDLLDRELEHQALSERSNSDGRISQREQTSQAILEIIRKEKEEQAELFKSMTQLSERTAWSMQENFSTLFYDAMTGELKSFEEYMFAIFDSILRAFSDMLAQMAVQKMFTNIISYGGSSAGGASGAVGSYSAAAALGAVFNRQGLVPFGTGGVVNRPTIFPFASGTGLMGESGPEAIMPLKRTSSGELGVVAEETGGITNVNIYCWDSKSLSDFVDRNRASFVQPIIQGVRHGDRPLMRALRTGAK